jgi:hypothetical protein
MSTTTLNEHDLRDLAMQAHAAANMTGQPDYLRDALAHVGETCQSASDGKAGQAEVQQAIDSLNAAFDHQHVLAWLRFDEAEDGDDPEAWRDALVGLIQVMPEHELRVVKDAFVLLLEHMLREVVADLEQMPVGGSC